MGGFPCRREGRCSKFQDRRCFHHWCVLDWTNLKMNRVAVARRAPVCRGLVGCSRLGKPKPTHWTRAIPAPPDARLWPLHEVGRLISQSNNIPGRCLLHKARMIFLAFVSFPLPCSISPCAPRSYHLRSSHEIYVQYRDIS